MVETSINATDVAGSFAARCKRLSTADPDRMALRTIAHWCCFGEERCLEEESRTTGVPLPSLRARAASRARPPSCAEAREASAQLASSAGASLLVRPEDAPVVLRVMRVFS